MEDLTLDQVAIIVARTLMDDETRDLSLDELQEMYNAEIAKPKAKQDFGYIQELLLAITEWTIDQLNAEEIARWKARKRQILKLVLSYEMQKPAMLMNIELAEEIIRYLERTEKT